MKLCRLFSSVKKTALYDFHIANGGKMVDFAGWQMPIYYPEGSLASHHWTRKYASIFDVSHMLQTQWSGKDVTKFLESLVVSDLKEMPIGGSTLSVFTNEKGGIIDDTVINKNGIDSFYVVTNAGCVDKDLQHIQERLSAFKKRGGDARVQVLDTLSLVALQGILI